MNNMEDKILYRTNLSNHIWGLIWSNSDYNFYRNINSKSITGYDLKRIEPCLFGIIPIDSYICCVHYISNIGSPIEIINSRSCHFLLYTSITLRNNIAFDTGF